MPARKRTAAEAISPEISGSSRRRSHRISSSGKKSSYFEADNDDDDDELGRGPPPRKAMKAQPRASLSGRRKSKKEDDELQYENEEQVSEDEDEDEDDGFVEDKDESDEDDFESDATPPPAQKRGRGRPSKGRAATAVTPKKSAAKSRTSDVGMGMPRSKAKPKAKPKKKLESEEPEADEYGGEEDDDDEEDEEDRITFIPATKLRDTGGVDYEDTRLHKNTFLFLKDLKANNQRAWLKTHDAEYRRSLKDWESFVTTLTDKIIEADETIPELPIKDVVFRIYRDIRFSKDPTPYKPHYSAAWSRTGRKGPYACYYVHAEPGRCMVGGGLWHPAADALARLRANIDERPHRIRRVLMNPTFRETFLPDAKPNEKAVLGAFAKLRMNRENALKTKPKGFNPDHRDVELLKLRNYTVGTYIEDADLVAEDSQERIMRIIGAMVEFVTYLNNVVMPDPGFDSDSDDADDGAEGQEEQEQEEEEEATEEENGGSDDEL